MVTTHLVPPDIAARYEVREWRNACGVLSAANPAEWQDIIDVLRGFDLLKSEILMPGGRKSPIAGRIDSEFYKRGWIEQHFETAIVVDGVQTDSPTHSVDCFKGDVGVEVEWNNKDPFYDRDLNNFRLLFELRTLAAGVIITRSDDLQALFDSFGKQVANKYGASTTHMGKLIPRIEGGGGGGCPIIVFGITQNCYVADI